MHFTSLLPVLSLATAFPLTISFTGLNNEVSENPLVKSLPGEKPIPGNSPVSVCDIYEPKILTVDQVLIDPSPPQKGANLSFSATGSLKKIIEEGAYVDVDVRYGYIKLLDKTFDLCEEIKNVDMTCPISSGAQDITKTVEIPAEVPPGRYTVYARAFTADDEYIACLTATVSFDVDSFTMRDYLKFGKRVLFGF